MNMKKKLRRAFRNATPNVLTRVIPDTSAENKTVRLTAENTEAPPVDKKTVKRERLQEFLATAAALALLIGAVGGGFWYVRDHGLSSGSNGGNAVVAPTQAPRVPIEKDALYDQWITAAKCCVEPEDMNNVIPTDTYFRTTWDGKDAYIVSVTYNGYLYELTFSDSSLENMLASQVTSAADDERMSPITESAAINIALTQVEETHPGTNFAWFLNGLLLDWDENYYVTLMRTPYGDFSNNEYKTICIGAYTGQILDVQSFTTVGCDDIVTDISVQKTLWELVSDGNTDIPMYQWLNYVSSSAFVREGDLIYRFTFTYGGFESVFETDRTGQLLSIDVAATGSSRNNCISQGVAQQIAFLAFADQITDGMYAETRLQGDYYIIVFRNGDAEVQFTCYVDAYTCQLLDGIRPSPVDIRDIALAFYSIDLEDCQCLVMEYEDKDTEYERIRVSAISGTVFYVAAVRTSDGEIVDDYVLMTEEPEYSEKDGIVFWKDARNTALEALDIRLEELLGMSIAYDTALDRYDFLFTCSNAERSGSVDAVTGQFVDMTLIPEADAWAVMLEQLPEETREAWQSGTLQTSSALYTNVAVPYYELWLTDRDTYVAVINAVTGELMDFSTIAPDPAPPDGNIGEENAVFQAIDALIGGDDVVVTVISCCFVEGEDEDYYLVDYFAMGCYYRVAVGAYGMGHLWHEGYDFVDTLDIFSLCFGAMGSWENMALTHTYDGPDQLDPLQFFYNGLEENIAPTDLELEQLQNDPLYHEEWDLFRLPVAQMNALLQDYFGCTLEAVNTDTLSNAMYVESTDCYYLCHSDAKMAENFGAIGLIHYGDIYQMYYHLDGDSVYVLTFEYADGDMLIYSNREVDLYE